MGCSKSSARRWTVWGGARGKESERVVLSERRCGSAEGEEGGVMSEPAEGTEGKEEAIESSRLRSRGRRAGQREL